MAVRPIHELCEVSASYSLGCESLDSYYGVPYVDVLDGRGLPVPLGGYTKIFSIPPNKVIGPELVVGGDDELAVSILQGSGLLAIAHHKRKSSWQSEVYHGFPVLQMEKESVYVLSNTSPQSQLLFQETYRPQAVFRDRPYRHINPDDRLTVDGELGRFYYGFDAVRPVRRGHQSLLLPKEFTEMAAAVLRQM